MNSLKLKYILNFLMFLVFLSLLSTGLIKFPGFLNLLGLSYTVLPMYQINILHDWSGIVLAGLIIIHLMLHRGWIKSFLSFRSARYPLFVLLGAGVVVLVFFLNNIGPSQKAKQLASREVREYQGEDLSSINDLRETSISGTQHIEASTYQLEITGLVENPKKYSYEQLLDFDRYSKVVEINCVTGWSAKILWEGILLKDVMESVGIDPRAKTVIFYGQDGFTTSLPLDFVIGQDILFASKANGVVLPPEKGFPFQVVAEQKWGYKWAKWVVKIELSDDENYLGTYEKAGYSKQGDLDKPKRD